MRSLGKTHVSKALADLVCCCKTIDVIHQSQDANCPNEQSQTHRRVAVLKTSQSLRVHTGARSHFPKGDTTPQACGAQALTQGLSLVLFARKDRR